MAALRPPQHQGEAMLSSSAMSENPFVEAGTASLGEDSDIDFDAAPPADTERRSGLKFKTVAQMAALATSGNPFVEADATSPDGDENTDFDGAAPEKKKGLKFKTAAQMATFATSGNPFVEADATSLDGDDNADFDGAAPATTPELTQQHTEKRRGLKFKTVAQMAALATSENPFVEADAASLNGDGNSDFDGAAPATTPEPLQQYTPAPGSSKGLKFKTVAQMAALRPPRPQGKTALSSSTTLENPFVEPDAAAPGDNENINFDTTAPELPQQSEDDPFTAVSENPWDATASVANSENPWEAAFIGSITDTRADNEEEGSEKGNENVHTKAGAFPQMATVNRLDLSSRKIEEKASINDFDLEVMSVTSVLSRITDLASPSPANVPSNKRWLNRGKTAKKSNGPRNTHAKDFADMGTFGTALVAKTTGGLELHEFAFVDRHALFSSEEYADYELFDENSMVSEISNIGGVSTRDIAITRAFEEYLREQVMTWGEKETANLSVQFLVAFSKIFTHPLDIHHRIRSTQLSKDEVMVLSNEPYCQFVDQRTLQLFQG